MLNSPSVTPYHGDIIDSARKLALAEHAKHMHGDLPYSYHLVAVAGIVSCYTMDPEVIAAAWLHDIVEDCPDIDLDVVEQMTSARVRDIVDRLTDPPGPRVLAKQKSMPRILACKDASLVKQADRFHNHASTIMESSEKYARTYLNEFDDFCTGFIRAQTATPMLFDLIQSQKWYLQRIVAREPAII